MIAPDIDRASALLSGLVDAMRLSPRHDAVRRELRLAFDLSCGGVAYRSLCAQPAPSEWQSAWAEIARVVSAHVESFGETRAHRARARRWSYHVSAVDAEWERL